MPETVNAECVLWSGPLNSRGYGVVRGTGSQRGTRRMAHRVAYEAVHGPIPDGLEIDHLCRTPACVNVLHLEAVTPAENKRRAWQHREGLKPDACPKGHPYDAENTRVYLRPGRTTPDHACRACARLKEAAYRARKALANA